MQTTGGFSFKEVEVGISTNGSSWTDISGFAAGVSAGGGDRQTGEVYTFDGDTAIITSGKREPLEVTVKAVYTEGGSDPFEVIRAAYEAGSSLYVRWSPKGGDASEFMFTSAVGVVTNAPYPVGESGSGDPTMFEFTVKVASITKSVIA